jgi:hypothetical protein
VDRNIYAYTGPGHDYPEYISISEDENGRVRINMRSRGNGGTDTAGVLMTRDKAAELSEVLSSHLGKPRELPKAPSHPDVPRPSDDELAELALQVCYAIEACGASTELTKAVCLASDLHTYLKKPRVVEGQ